MEKLQDKILHFEVRVLEPYYISYKMLASKNQENLNDLSHNSAISIIQYYLDEGYNLKQVFLDTVGPKDSYREKLNKIFNTDQNRNIKITVEEKADSKYKVVSAASICAKVTRDRRLKEWEFKEGNVTNRNFGSGYPSDPATKLWLQTEFKPVFGYPTFIRFSWSTATTA